MADFLVRRLFLMVPTFVGVSLVIWLVMTLAPGEPQGAGGGALGADTPQDLRNLEVQSRNVRLFRRQFNLDRPRFWNDWTSLEKEDVLAAARTLAEGVVVHGPRAVQRARRSLEDWSAYAIPPLVELLGETEGAVQDQVLQSLRMASYTFRTVYAAGHKPTPEEIERDREAERENELVSGRAYRWDAGADGAARAAVVARWRAWFHERKGRWAWSAGERLEIAVRDTQFGKYWANLLTLDLGLSNRTREPVLSMIGSRLKYSLTIFLPGFAISWVLAIFLGVFSASRHGSAWDQGIGLGLFMLYSVPVFVAATLLQQILAVQMDLFPTDGFESPDPRGMNTLEHVKDILWHITLPMACYAYGGLAYISRQARSGMLQVMRSDYVRTARAKGLTERAVVWRHALRNGIMPVVTLLGTALPILVAGSVLIEFVFNIDGFGLLMVNAIFQKDYNVVMGVQLIVAVLTLVGLLLTDLTYAALDPRISLK